MIKGWWYPSDSSARRDAELSSDGTLYTITPNQNPPISGHLLQLEISQRVGNIPRKITLPDRSLFETTDNDAVDALVLRSGHHARHSGVLYQLETKWPWIGGALLATVFTVFAAVRWGIPWASNEIAYSLPLSVNEMISRQTLEVLDEIILEDSQLPDAQQQSIREHFDKDLLPLQDESFPYRLHFRSMQGIANAFALPSGDIIITDRLIEIAANQQEIDSVLLHEIGHVVHRHGMRQILHSSFITIAIIMISGDVTAVNNLAIALPVFLLENHYSRENESDADRYAFERMMQAGIDPIHFSRIMARISQEADEKTAKDGAVPGKKPDAEPADDSDSLLKYLSTHPPTPERMRQAENYSIKWGQRAIPSDDLKQGPQLR